MEKITNKTSHIQMFKNAAKALIGLQRVDVIYNNAWNAHQSPGI